MMTMFDHTSLVVLKDMDVVAKVFYIIITLFVFPLEACVHTLDH